MPAHHKEYILTYHGNGTAGEEVGYCFRFLAAKLISIIFLKIVRAVFFSPLSNSDHATPTRQTIYTCQCLGLLQDFGFWNQPAQ
jgi:hypothetical protein